MYFAFDAGCGLPFTGWQLARARCWSLMDCTSLKVAPDTIPRTPKVRLRDKEPTDLAGNKRVRNRHKKKEYPLIVNLRIISTRQSFVRFILQIKMSNNKLPQLQKEGKFREKKFALTYSLCRYEQSDYLFSASPFPRYILL